MRAWKNLFLKGRILALVLLSQAGGLTLAYAQSSSFTYEGRLYSSSGVPLLESVDVKFQILNPAGNCVLYEEVQSSVDLSTTKGAFSLGVGSAVGDTKRSANFRGAYNPSMISVFRNSATLSGIPAAGCAAGTYVAGASDTRLLRVQVTKGSTTETLSPDLVINTVPSAQVAASLQGFLPSDFLRLDVANGISGNIGLTATGTGAGQTREFRFYELAASGVEYSAFKAPDAMATSLTYVLPSAAPAAGDVLKATVPSSGMVTLSWGADAGAGGGISNFNGSNQSSQSFTAVDIAAVVTAPAWSTNTGTGAHTLQIPMASGAGVTGGLITKTEHTAFSSKVDRAGDTMTGLLNFTGATGVSLAGTSGITFTGTGTIAMGTNKITGVGDPTANQEAATKAYVDSQSSGKISGTLTATRIPYASGASTLADSANFTYLPATGAMTIGGTAPSITSNDAITIAAGGTNRNVVLTPSGTGFTLLNGNVGVGTTGPTSSFQVGSGASQYAINSSGQLSVQSNGFFPDNMYYSAVFGNALSIEGAFSGFQISDRASSTQKWQHYANAGIFRIWNNFGGGNNDRFAIDYATGNVGIGTTAPLDLLSLGIAPIASATRAQVNLSNTTLSSGSASGTYIGANPAAFTGNFIDLQVGGVRQFSVSSTGVITGNGSGLTGISGAVSGLTAGRVPFASSSTALGDDANLTWDNSNKRLGIGTASPIASLSVASETFPSANLDSYGANTPIVIGRRAGGTIVAPTPPAVDNGLMTLGGRGLTTGTTFSVNKAEIRLSASENWSTTANGTSVRFNTTENGTTTMSEKLRIDHNGNVGIGTTAPLDLLSLGTAPIAAATRAQVNLSNTTLSSGSANGTYIGANPAAFTGDFINFQVGGSSRFRVSGAGVVTGDGSGLTGVTPSFSGMTAGQVRFASSATALSGSANLFWDNTNSRLGIGTSSPVTPVHIVNTTNETLRIESTNTTGTAFSIKNTSAGGHDITIATTGSSNTAGVFGIWDNTTSRSLLGINGSNSAVGIGQLYSISSAIATGPSNGLIVEGYVGIGTPVPTEILHLSASGVAVSNLMHDTYGGIPQIIGRRAQGTSASPTVVAADNDLLFLGGRGFGTSGFSAGSKAGMRIRAAETWSDSAQGAYVSIETTPIGSTTRSETFRVHHNGNVGIGTTAPATKLDLRATTIDGDPILRIEGTMGGSIRFDGVACQRRSIDFFSAGAAMWALMGNDSCDDNFMLKSGGQYGTTRLSILQANGNVGIGTSGPTALLDVNSDTIRVRTAKTPASAAAACNAGEIVWDANYVYVCVATNTWKRSGLASW